MIDKIEEFEYVYIKCNQCNERAKLVKNKGAYFTQFNFLSKFFDEHALCDSTKLVLEFER